MLIVVAGWMYQRTKSSTFVRRIAFFANNPAVGGCGSTTTNAVDWRESQKAGAETSGRPRHHRHTRDPPGLAPETDPSEVRRQWQARTGAASDRRRDRGFGGSNAEENLDWEHRRIQAALSNLGHDLARSTIAEILQRHGIEPVPERRRKTTWKEFLTRHWALIVAADFFTVEVWTRRGLRRFIVLFFIELSTRKVEIAGFATVASRLWMSQIGRNRTDNVGGILRGKRYLIHDRDPLFTEDFLRMIAETGVQSVKLPPRSPNLNAYAERFVRSIKESCLERMIFFGESSLRAGIREFVAHYHGERKPSGSRKPVDHA
jgi:transposase InsO family protein